MIIFLLSLSLFVSFTVGRYVPEVRSDSSQNLRECALDCFAANKLPLVDPQLRNKTYFEDIHRESISIEGEELQTLLTFRGPRENDFMKIFYNLQRNTSIAIEREGSQIDVIDDPRRGRCSGETESMFVAYRRKQATCIWNCNQILNKLRGKWRRGQEVLILDRFGAYDRWTSDLVEVDAWTAMAVSNYPGLFYFRNKLHISLLQ
ncbi:hypothetical protein PENTCL1PPCAC_2872 [Pristionchus entomophagus]|uniref:Uncharacterized protein n=1 Tax=Pristionchus entomophagus TaxID=358040 RepID=A0AAV5SBL1_9BILA|nr:hypothetical protein PENTCL1PPCAC_2872 [Pristionchus entomophagus]